MIITPQRSIALLGIRLNWRRLFKVRKIPDEGKEPVVRDVQWGKLGKFPLFLLLLQRALLILNLAPLLLGLPFCDRLAILGGNHYCLGGCPDIVF